MDNQELLRIVDEFQKISAQINELVEKVSTQEKVNYRSEDIKDLATALAKAQGEINVASLNRSNPYFKSKYADLLSIVSAARPALSKYGLSVVQDIIAHADGHSVLHTILLHSSGQWIESRMRIVPPKTDIQSLSSYTTYLKRMAYSSLVGVVTGDEDDDGEIAMTDSRDMIAKGPALNNKYNPKEQSYETVTREQLEELEYELSECPDLAEEILSKFHLQSLADLPKNKYQASLNRIREIKSLRLGTK